MTQLKNTFKTERDFEREVRRLLRTREDVVLLPKIESGQEPGWPDIVFSVFFQAYAIELKMPGKKLFENQKNKITYLKIMKWKVLILYPKDYTLDNMVKFLSL